MPEAELTCHDHAELVYTENRRVGRAPALPVLIPLLRNPVGDGVLDDVHPEAELPDAGRPAHGIALAILLCAPIWLGAVFYAIYG